MNWLGTTTNRTRNIGSTPVNGKMFLDSTADMDYWK